MKIHQLSIALPTIIHAQKEDKGPTRGPRGRGRKLEEIQAMYQSQLHQSKHSHSQIFERTGELEDDKSRALSFAFLEQFSKVVQQLEYFNSYSLVQSMARTCPRLQQWLVYLIRWQPRYDHSAARPPLGSFSGLAVREAPKLWSAARVWLLLQLARSKDYTRPGRPCRRNRRGLSSMEKMLVLSSSKLYKKYYITYAK